MDPQWPDGARPASFRLPSALSDVELLTLILGGARAGRSGRERARRLLDERRLETWAALPPETCLLEVDRTLGSCDVRGVVAGVFELARRALGPSPGIELSRPEDVLPLLAEWRRASQEHFIGFYLNARNQLLARRVISLGSLSASIVHPREVFKPAITHSAAGLIVAHNHPSGDPEPSPEDLAVTRRLAQAGELIGIELLDHVVIAERGFVSLKSRGRV